MRNWLDVVVDWAERRRVPAWCLVLALWLVLILAANGAKWAVGNLDADEHIQVTYDAAYLPLALVFYGVLRGRARRAFDRFRPALGPSAQGAPDALSFASLRAWAVVVATIAGAVLGFSSLVGDDTGVERLGSTPVEYVVNGGIGVALPYGAFIAVGTYGVVLVTRIVRLHRTAVNVDLFRRGPAHAFASVTAALSVFLVVGVSYSTLTDPATWATPFNRAFGVATLATAMGVFVIPLLGMRSRLRAARDERRDANSARLSATVARIEAAIDSGKDSLVAPMNDSVAALRAEGERTAKASTWPWEPSTLRGVVSSLLLPVMTWGITTGISRLLGVD